MTLGKKDRERIRFILTWGKGGCYVVTVPWA